MDFSWSASQTDLYNRALDFCRTRLKGLALSGAFPRDAWGHCGEFGLLGLSVPQAHGGMGLDALTTARVFEAFGRGCEDTGLVFAAAAHLFACAMPLAEHATPEVKGKLVSKLASGELIGANAITEGEAGSDVFALKARAQLEGDTYRLEGAKTYVTNGTEADVFLVYASTAPQHGMLGISAFVVERGTPGLRVGDKLKKVGLHSAPLASVYLEDCRVPVSHRVGTEGGGAAVFRHSMQWERSCLFALYVGLMERQLEASVAFARERRQFGKAIGKFQAISHRLVQMKLRLETARLLLYRTCWLRDSGQVQDADISLAKLAISEAAVEMGMDAIRIHGGLGVVEEGGVEVGLRDAIPSLIFSGTSEMQHEIIVRSLGL